MLAWTPTHCDADRTVARIWQISLDRIRTHSGELPQQLLQTLAWYGPDDIPVGVLYGIALDRAQIDRALGRLAAYALLTRTGDAVSIHRLVQAVTRTPATYIDATRNPAAQALLAALPSEMDRPAEWPTWRRLIPHVEALAAHTDPSHDDEHTVRLLSYTARFLREQGRPQRAIPLFERALADRRRVSG